MSADNDPLAEQQEAEGFWANPIWWIFSKLLTIIGLASPIAAIVVFLTNISDVHFEISAWYLWFMCGSVIVILPLTLLNYASTRYLEKFKSITAATDSLCGQYAISYLRQSFIGLAIAAASCVSYAFFTNDYTALLAILVYMVLTFGYYFVITLRIKAGLFGNNSIEVEELLSFLYSDENDEGPDLKRLHVPGRISATYAQDIFSGQAVQGARRLNQHGVEIAQ